MCQKWRRLWWALWDVNQVGVLGCPGLLPCELWR